MKFNGCHLSPSFSSCFHCSHTSGPMLVWYKSITNRQDKKWECEGKKRKRGIDVEERIGVTAKTIFLLQQTLQLRGTLSLPRDWEFLPKVLYQLVQDFFNETLYPLEQKRVCFAFMINTRWWERGGNGAKREQYLDWWNKNWLETRLSQNPLIFFVSSSSIFLFTGFHVGCSEKTRLLFKVLEKKTIVVSKLMKLRHPLFL